MKHPVGISSLDIGHVASLAIRVPITTIGKDSPRLGILCGVHGEETSSLVIARQFVRQLLKFDELAGSVSILTATNPFAQATRTHTAASDLLDLNRHGQGRSDGTLTERLAHTLRDYLSNYAFIVDLHEFIMATPPLVVYVPCSQPEIDRHILPAIAAFRPACVWMEEPRYSGGVVSTLIKDGIPGFGVETSRLAELSWATIHEVADGLIEVAKLVGVLEGQPRTSAPPAFILKIIHSDHAGLWIPRATLFHQVKPGESIGDITPLSLIEDIPILSQTEGTLMQLASKALVDTGTDLFAIGVNDPELTMKMRSISQNGEGFQPE